jgi:hypothetical protein
VDPSKPPTVVPSIGIPTVVHSIDPSFSLTKSLSQLAEIPFVLLLLTLLVTVQPYQQ